jgi:hypothetical protein
MSVENYYDVIVVGAGPAGLFAALELANRGISVALIDKGKTLDERKCPLKMGIVRTCAHCNSCSLMCGWGGAGAFSDGKLTLTPHFGGNLEKYIGKERLLALLDEVDSIWRENGADSAPLFEPDPEFASKVIKKARVAGLHVIPAKIRHIGTDRTKEVLRNIYCKLRDKVHILMNTEVKRVLIADGGVAGVELSSGEKLNAKFVLLAPGREGAPWMERASKELGLQVDSLPVDVGVRVEIPAELAEELTEQFYEVKAIYNSPTFDDQVRTFCMCPHGEVVTEFQSDGGVVTVNGHSFRDKSTDNTNFAILVSTNFTEPFHDPNGYGVHIARLANMLGGSVLVQRLGDLKLGRRSTRSRIERGLVKPTLAEAEPGDLSFALPYRHLKDILEMLEALESIIPHVNDKYTLLYGIEVKFYSLKLSLNERLQTSIKGLYAAGDGAGVTRGVIQAAASGLVSARSMLEEIHETISKN